MKNDTHYHAKDAHLSLPCHDSLFDTHLFLTGDGRKRGLWIWLEEDAQIRVDNDAHIFEQNFDAFVKFLKNKEVNFADPKPSDVLNLMLGLNIHFEYFFGHRTEAAGIRLTWGQARKLAKALMALDKSEKDKTEEYE